MPRAGRGILPEGSAEQTAPVKRYMVEPNSDGGGGCMIYRGVKQEIREKKRRNRRDILKAVLYASLAVGTMVAAVMLVRQFGVG